MRREANSRTQCAPSGLTPSDDARQQCASIDVLRSLICCCRFSDSFAKFHLLQWAGTLVGSQFASGAFGGVVGRFLAHFSLK